MSVRVVCVGATAEVVSRWRQAAGRVGGVTVRDAGATVANSGADWMVVSTPSQRLAAVEAGMEPLRVVVADAALADEAVVTAVRRMALLGPHVPQASPLGLRVGRWLLKWLASQGRPEQAGTSGAARDKYAADKVAVREAEMALKLAKRQAAHEAKAAERVAARRQRDQERAATVVEPSPEAVAKELRKTTRDAEKQRSREAKAAKADAIAVTAAAKADAIAVAAAAKAGAPRSGSPTSVPGSSGPGKAERDAEKQRLRAARAAGTPVSRRAREHVPTAPRDSAGGRTPDTGRPPIWRFTKLARQWPSQEQK